MIGGNQGALVVERDLGMWTGASLRRKVTALVKYGLYGHSSTNSKNSSNKPFEGI